jgi:protein-L-isoaspartate(D-aspartate) O-methyltransferase
MPSEPGFAAMRERMVEHQLRRRGIRDERVLEAMGRVPRELFVDVADRPHAYDDAALGIGYGQTISQPYMVAATCELLGLSGDEHVLDVGAGSGYAAAVLAELAESVVTVERLPELAERARTALAAVDRLAVEVVVGDGSLGVPPRAPYHAIAVAAAAPRVPASLYGQLTPGGRLVVPLGSRSGQRLALVVRTPDGPAELRSLPCRYVPLLGAEGFAR